jgi:hypothetical protein
MAELAAKVFPSEDPRLDWVSQHDPESLNYPIRAVMASTVEKRPKLWKPPAFALDQGREGACVGFGWTGELIGSPFPDRTAQEGVANLYARGHYLRAKQIDEFPGEDYDGTSVLAGAKVAQERDFLDEYRWALSVEDLRDAVITTGPAVLGIPWYEDMYETRPSGLVEVGGELVGGHCIYVYGYHPAMRIRGEDYESRFEVFRWRNSWGASYGNNGSGLIRLEDLRDLLKTWGEACIPVTRRKVRLGASA